MLQYGTGAVKRRTTACATASSVDGRSVGRPARRLASNARIAVNVGLAAALLAPMALLAGCGPRAHIPPRSLAIPGAIDRSDSVAVLARTMAPLLYLQRDEKFPLTRAVAAVHPTERVIAYYLLWRDDVHGSWVPFTIPTDEEVVWVGYDSTLAPTDLWTYWHGTLLHADWRGKGQLIIDVQWGKHGSLPHRTRYATLPKTKMINSFYALTIFGIWDMWLGNLTRKGPWCFCHSFARYLDFSRPLWLNERLDAVVRTTNPDETLRAVFGRKYSEKPFWPWGKHAQPPAWWGDPERK